MEHIQNNPFDGVDINTLADINDVQIDTNLPVEERKKSYLRQIRNPSLFRYGDTMVKLTFADSGVTLNDRLREYLLTRSSTDR